jgi:ubiquinone biosynthesis protein
VAISLQPQHLRRYREIARLLIKYGRSDVVRQAGLGELAEIEEGQEEEAAAEATELATDLEKLGPTYIKLGQLLSTRVDLLPEAWLTALSRLQDDVEPIPWEQVEETVSGELGMRISKAFSSFEQEPLASASLGQVHRATLPSGRTVAVKVQRPGIRQMVTTDMEALEDIAEFIDNHTEMGRKYGTVGILAELKRTLFQELDYRAEAQHLKTLGRNLAGFERLVVPQPVDDRTTERVLTMDFVEGTKITDLSSDRIGADGRELADQLFQAYLQQILSDGFFHADPHPGNVLMTDDGRLALVDLGMVARISPDLQECLLRMLLAVSEGRGREVAEILIGMGETLPTFEETSFVAAVADLVARNQDANVSEMQSGRIVVELTQLAGDNGLRPPPALTLLGKALLNLDQVGRVLDPDFQPANAIQQHAAKIMRDHVFKSASQANLFSTMLDTKELVEKLPNRMNRIMEALSNNDFKINVDAIDEEALIGGIEKIANRVTMGVILAAMIIGAAMLMRVETEHEILGYPALAILFFLIAALGGITLMLTMLISDRRRRREGP